MLTNQTTKYHNKHVLNTPTPTKGMGKKYSDNHETEQHIPQGSINIP